MHHTLKTFIDLVQFDINEIKAKKVKNLKSYPLNGEQEALKHLAKWSDKTITTAEKDGAVVIMDTENYIKEPNYKILQTEPFTTQ